MVSSVREPTSTLILTVRHASGQSWRDHVVYGDSYAALASYLFAAMHVFHEIAGVSMAPLHDDAVLPDNDLTDEEYTDLIGLVSDTGDREWEPIVVKLRAARLRVQDREIAAAMDSRRREAKGTKP